MENSDNPFAIVVLTVLLALRTSGNKKTDLVGLSVDLVRRMYKKGFSKEKIRTLFDFLQSYLFFNNKDLIPKFEKEIDTITKKEHTMTTREIALMLYREQFEIDGHEKAQATIVKNLLEKSNHSAEEIADLCEVPIDFVIGIKNDLYKIAS